MRAFEKAEEGKDSSVDAGELQGPAQELGLWLGPEQEQGQEQGQEQKQVRVSEQELVQGLAPKLK